MGASTTTTITCKARQFSDQMSCDRCGLVWDLNDDDPPECKTDRQLSEEIGRAALRETREKLKS